jgi:hypothetical protein
VIKKEKVIEGVNLINDIYMSEILKQNSLEHSIFTLKNEGEEGKIGPICGGNQ